MNLLCQFVFLIISCKDIGTILGYHHGDAKDIGNQTGEHSAVNLGARPLRNSKCYTNLLLRQYTNSIIPSCDTDTINPAQLSMMPFGPNINSQF